MPFQRFNKALTAALVMSFAACSESTSPTDTLNAVAPTPPVSLAIAAPAPSYIVSAVAFEPEALPTIGIGPNCDDCVSAALPIGFSFAFFGNAYTQIFVGANGVVGFTAASMRDGCCNGIPLPVNDFYNNVIAIGQNDWMPNAVQKGIRFETRGAAPNRRFVLQFNNVPESGGNGRLTVQIVLFEGSNDIVLYTTTLSTTLRTRIFTQGIENLTGTEAYFVAGRVQSSFSLSNDAVKFSPPVPNRAPVITAPANRSVTTTPPSVEDGSTNLVARTNACAAIVDPGMPEVLDDAPGVTTIGVRNDGLALDAAYPKGTTTITWTATDAEGLTGTATQTIAVLDSEAPQITPPATIKTRTDAGASTATVVVGEAVAADNCPNVAISTSRSDNQPLSAPFNIGVTAIQWIATDASGNTNSANQKIIVVANNAPVISAPANISMPSDLGVCSAIVNPGEATATDDAEGTTVSGVRNDGGAVNGAYPKGVTTIMWTATDADGSTATASQTVTVSDNQKPSVQAPANIQVDNSGNNVPAAVSVGSAAAADNCHEVVVSGARNDGAALDALYPVGTTMIVWTAIDPSGNSASATQSITVRNVFVETRDLEAPSLNVPADFAVNATMPRGAVVNFAVNASDNVGVISLSCDRNSGSVFPIGYTSVSCSASDAAGNRAAKAFRVKVLNADEQIQNLILYIGTLPLKDASSRKLVKELNEVLRQRSDRKACDRLDDFLDKLDKRERGISAPSYLYMTREADRIQDVMSCRGKRHHGHDDHDMKPPKGKPGSSGSGDQT
jgi:hypothetical protein